MIKIRHAEKRDEDVAVALAAMQAAETVSHLPFEDSVARETFRTAIATGAPLLFLADDEGDVIGFILVVMTGYFFNSGHSVSQEVIYVRPDKRGGRAAAKLTQFYLSWAEKTGAKEAFMGIANGFNIDRNTRFFEHFGLTVVGTYLRKVFGGSNG